MSVLDFLRDIGKHFPVNRMLARDVVRNRLEDGSPTPSSPTSCCSPWTTWSCTAARLHAAVRRQRPVGEHHRRRRAGPPGRRRPGARARDPADDQGRRDEVRQDRGGSRLAGPGDDLAVRVPPVLPQRGGRQGGRVPEGVQPAQPRGDRGAGAADAGAAAPAGGPEGAGRRRHRAGALPGRSGTRRWRRPRPSSAGPTCATCRRGAGRSGRGAGGHRARPRRDCRRSSRSSSGAGWSSRGAARRAITEGGAYINNAKVADVDAVLSADDLLDGRYVIARRGKRTVGAVTLVGAP